MHPISFNAKLPVNGVAWREGRVAASIQRAGTGTHRLSFARLIFRPVVAVMLIFPVALLAASPQNPPAARARLLDDLRPRKARKMRALPGPAARARLLDDLRRIAETSGGMVGLSAWHIETGERVSIRGDERFPMGSVYKLPIAVSLFQRIERGDVSLTDKVRLTERDYRPGHSPLALSTNAKPVTLSVAELLRWMLEESDNTACDAILRLVGGPAAVTKQMREIGIGGIDVDRAEVHLSADFSGVCELPPEKEWSLHLFRRLFAQVDKAGRDAAAMKFAQDARDTSTPVAMTELLMKLQRGEVLRASSTNRIFQLLTSTRTGLDRLKGLLPAHTVVAHKTGSMGAAATNDVGIITLPGGRGHLAIAVFVKASSKDLADRERAIAEIARRIYDSFLSPPLRTFPREGIKLRATEARADSLFWG